MKILVTGSNGLLGQKLTELYLNDTSVELIATSRGANRFPREGQFVYDSLDITNATEVDEVIRRHQPEVIIHTAAMTNVDACELDKPACDKMNVDAVKYLVEAANEVKAHFIFLSTDFIFDGSHGPLLETEPPSPLSYYGQSKQIGEEWVKQHAAQWAIARTVLVYGVVSDMSRSNIVLWAKSNLEQGKPLNVVGDQFRTPTLAEDLARGCAAIAAKKATGIYNLSGKDFMSVFDLVYRVADFWNLDKSLLSLSTSEGIRQPAKRPPISGFIIEKARRDLGYEPHSFVEGLRLVDQQLKASNP